MTPRIQSVRAAVYRAPVQTPVVTSFGVMRDRPMVLVRVADMDGAVGWGEVWCNFPTVGAEHRARLVDSVLAGLLEGEAVPAVGAVAWLSERTSVLALQSGEPGPFAAAIAGVEIALWDLAARRAGLPLFRLLGGTDAVLPVYASGLNPDQPAALARARYDEGHRAFKLKIGFGREQDRANLAALRTELGDGVALMVDANQGWTLAEALDAVPDLAEYGLRWLEEPLRADRPWAEWQQLAAATAIPLAAGENLAGAERAAAIRSGAITVFQPDAAKEGGIALTLGVARDALHAGLTYCPHWLGGGIGLLASAHLLAAAGGPGLLEVDSNPNPLRSLLCGSLGTVTEGMARLAETPGLGPAPDLAALERYKVPH